jgi:hypothetical protein
MKDLMKDEVEYFVAWMQEDNMGMPNMSYEAAREVYKYRVFRDDGGAKSEPVTEVMTYQEAQVKVREIRLITEGSEYVRD